jgi:hypothetical protein
MMDIVRSSLRIGVDHFNKGIVLLLNIWNCSIGIRGYLKSYDLGPVHVVHSEAMKP